MDLDDIDRQILAALQNEGRLKNRAIAAQIGLSPSACLERVRRLERGGVILGYRAIIDHTAVGRPFEVWGEVALVDHSPDAVKRFIDLLRRTESIISAYRMAGRHDFLIQSVAESANAWDALVNRVADEGIAIAAARTSVVVERVKHNAPIVFGHPSHGDAGTY